MWIREIGSVSNRFFFLQNGPNSASPEEKGMPFPSGEAGRFQKWPKIDTHSIVLAFNMAAQQKSAPDANMADFGRSCKLTSRPKACVGRL